MEWIQYREAALYEHRFWLQVLGDHGRFILDALSPKEVSEVHTAERFIETFDRLLEEARKPLQEQELGWLNKEANRMALQIREFKLHLIRKLLASRIAIELPPTFINHMVNEVEEYLRVLACLVKNEMPPKYDAIHHHLVWLLDAAGHADSIAGSMDMVEKSVRIRSQQFTEIFEHFYIKAVEMAGYMRSKAQQFPAFSRFNKQVELEIQLFYGFLRELEEMELNVTVLSTLAPLMADHMAREECYYLGKLSQVSEVERPPCDPAKPRTEKD